MMMDIAEPLFQAMDQIIAERLKSVNYDTTIVATIIDASKAKEHKYQCKSEAATFEAYSDNTDYKEDNTVLVTVPNNDFSQQKTIIGKYVAKDNNGPYNLVLPLDSFVDATSNLIYNASAEADRDYSKKIGLLANNDDKSITPDIQYNETSGKFEFDGKVFDRIWSSTKTHIGYTRLGLKGQFQSHLYGLNVVKGNYGYYLILKVEDDNAAGETPLTKFVSLTLDTSDMFGDPYNFEAFYQQEKVFDISSYKNIVGMELYFYQEKNFINKDGQPIGTQDDFGNELGNNLFTKDPYVALGFDAADFSGETAIIYSSKGTTYKTTDEFLRENGSTVNDKDIYLRWLYKDSSNKITIIDTIGEKPDNVDITWSYFPVGDKAIGWKNITIEEGKNPFSIIFTPQINTSEERVKATITINNSDGTKRVIESNVLRFINQDETASNLTQNLMAGLSLYCEDESYGNYYVYDQANKIYQDFHKERRRIKAVFHDYDIKTGQYNELQVSDIAQEIIWEFPKSNTMITVEGWNSKLNDNNGGYSYSGDTTSDCINIDTTSPLKDENNNYMPSNKIQIGRIKQDIQENGTSHIYIKDYQEYHINSTYNASAFDNTVECRILYNGLWYSASKDFSFGLMGTNGSDVSVEIDFDNNKVALTAGEVNEYKVTAHIYNSAHQEISNTSSYKFEWSWEYKHPEDSTTISLDNTDKKSCIIKTTTGLKIDTFLVLKVKILGILSYLDEEGQDPLEFPLIAYKAIPIRSKKEYRYIIAPTQIIYSSSGYPDFYKDSMKIYRVPDGEVNSNDFATVDIIEETGGAWSIWDPYEIGSEYRGVIGKNNVLKPLEYFIKNVKPYGIQYTNGGQVVWSQPLVIMQNEYPSAVVNKWNGKSIELNNEKGYFLSPAIAAGKKVVDSSGNNSFSGVMLGDLNHLEATSDLTKMTGLYGFHEGATSFAFMEDGTAYIGKSNHGRINFDGTKSVIESNKMARGLGGMRLDFDDGLIELKSPRTDPSDSSKQYTIKLDAGANQNPVVIGDYFKVNWDGTINASNGNFSGSISASEINGSDIWGSTIRGATIHGSQIYGAQMYFGSEKTAYKYSRVNSEGEKMDDIILDAYKGDSFVEDGITYTYMQSIQISNAGYLGLGRGGSGGVDTSVLLLESTDDNLSIKIQGNKYVALQSHSGTVMLQSGASYETSSIGVRLTPTGTGEIDVYATAGTTFRHTNSQVSIYGTLKAGMNSDYSGYSFMVNADSLICTIPAANQTGIYARFA